MILLFANNAQTTLAAALNSSATTVALAVGGGALLPNPSAGQGFLLTFVDAATELLTEIVLVTAMSGDTITTMIREQEGTTAKSWLVGDIAAQLNTAGTDAAQVQAAQLQAGIYSYGAAAGTGNALTATIQSPLTSIPDGFAFTLKAYLANTGAAALVLTLGSTLLSSAAIVKGDNIPLVAGDIPAVDYPIELVWSAAWGAYVMQNPVTVSLVNPSINIAGTGHIWLANSLLLQWGTFNGNATAGHAVAVDFDIPFPNGYYAIAIGVNSESTSTTSCWYDTPTVNGFNGHTSASDLACYYLAIGN